MDYGFLVDPEVIINRFSPTQKRSSIASHRPRSDHPSLLPEPEAMGDRLESNVASLTCILAQANSQTLPKRGQDRSIPNIAPCKGHEIVTNATGCTSSDPVF